MYDTHTHTHTHTHTEFINFPQSKSSFLYNNLFYSWQNCWRSKVHELLRVERRRTPPSSPLHWKEPYNPTLLLKLGICSKPAYKDHPRDCILLFFIDRWSLCRGAIVLLWWFSDQPVVVSVHRWSFFYTNGL